MKKAIGIMAALFTLTTGAALAEAAPTREISLTRGAVTVYDFGDVKLHAYHLGDALADECYLVESTDGLVMIETGLFTADLEVWKTYIDTLNKPVAGALLAYHPNGIELFGDVPVYATENALKSWGEGGSIRNLVDSFVGMFGEGVNTSLPATANLVKAGDTVRLAGVDFIIREEGDDAYGVEIPAINSVYIHMMGSGVHNILTSRAHIQAFMEELKGFQYDLVLTSHHAPEGQDAVAAKVAYLQKTLEIAAAANDAASFTSAMKEAFPDYEGDNYLAMTAGFLFPAQ